MRKPESFTMMCEINVLKVRDESFGKKMVLPHYRSRSPRNGNAWDVLQGRLPLGLGNSCRPLQITLEIRKATFIIIDRYLVMKDMFFPLTTAIDYLASSCPSWLKSHRSHNAWAPWKKWCSHLRAKITQVACVDVSVAIRAMVSLLRLASRRRGEQGSSSIHRRQTLKSTLFRRWRPYVIAQAIVR